MTEKKEKNQAPPNAKLEQVSWVVIVLAVVSHDIVYHLFCVHGRTVRVKLYGCHVTVEGFLVVTLSAVFVALPVVFFCCHDGLGSFFMERAAQWECMSPYIIQFSKGKNNSEVFKLFYPQ